MDVTQEQLRQEHKHYQDAKDAFLKRAEEAQKQLQAQRDTIMQQRIDLKIKESEFEKQKEDDCALVLKRNTVSFLFLYHNVTFTVLRIGRTILLQLMSEEKYLPHY